MSITMDGLKEIVDNVHAWVDRNDPDIINLHVEVFNDRSGACEFEKWEKAWSVIDAAAKDYIDAGEWNTAEKLIDAVQTRYNPYLSKTAHSIIKRKLRIYADLRKMYSELGHQDSVKRVSDKIKRISADLSAPANVESPWAQVSSRTLHPF